MNLCRKFPSPSNKKKPLTTSSMGREKSYPPSKIGTSILLTGVQSDLCSDLANRRMLALPYTPKTKCNIFFRKKKLNMNNSYH